jgi:hypothetical protein
MRLSVEVGGGSGGSRERDGRGRERADLTIPTAPDKVCFASAAAQFILILIFACQLSRFALRSLARKLDGTYKAAHTDPIRMDLST